MIKFENVSKIYNGTNHTKPTVALDKISFQIKPKEFISIVGRSGAGKSTIVKLLTVEEKPTEGDISVDGIEYKNVKSAQLPVIRRRIGTVFQDFKLLANKTVFENVAFALEVVDKTESEIQELVPQVLDLVGLLDKTNNFSHEISGGEKQRVALARALVHRPDVIVADEPTGNLDPINTWDIIKLLLKINELGTTVVLATHNREIVNTLDKRVITLEQ